MQSFVHHYGYFGLLVLSILSSACFPIPSEVAYGFAGALCTTAITGHAQFTVWGVIVVGTVGSLIGAVIAYEVARSAGRTIVDRWGKWLLLTHQDLDASERWFEKYGSWSVLIGRVLPVVRSFISVPAGLAEMKRGRFIILTTIGSAVWVALLAGSVTPRERTGTTSRVTSTTRSGPSWPLSCSPSPRRSGTAFAR